MKRIIVDSGCDGTAEFKRQLGIETVPLTLTLGEEHFVDDESLNLPEYMEKMKACIEKVGSACPSPVAYEQAFLAVEEGTAYGVTISANLSASYSSAMLGKTMAEEQDKDVHVFDSKSASAGELLIAIQLRRLIDKGLPKMEIVSTVEAFIKKMNTYFVLDNLDNLVKNGRLNKIAGKLVSVMHIKPVMGADGDGNIAFFSYARGMKNVIVKLVDMVEKSGKETEGKDMVISHCNNPSLAEQLQQAISKRFQFKNIFVVPTGGLSSLYANEGGIIIAF